MNFENKVAECFAGQTEILRHVVGMQTPGDSLGKRIVGNSQVKGFLEGKHNTARFMLTDLEIKAAIIGTGAQNDPLTNAARPEIALAARRRLFVRDLLLKGQTDQGAIEYPVETANTDNSGSQNGQNTALSESDFTFGLTFQACETIGHFATVSKQVLQDSGVLNSFLQNSLLYGLRLEEERQILNGLGTGGELNGIIGQATAWANESPNITNELDVIRSAIKQLQLADFTPQAILLNPQDWFDIDARKSGGNNDKYTSGDPRDMMTPRLWGVPVVVTNAITAGTFLVADFARGAVLFDRQQAGIQFSRHHGSNFVKNMITMLAETRVGLVVANAAALVTGSL